MLWYGGYLVYHLRLQAGTLISIMLYTLNLAMAFAFLSNLYGEFMQVSLAGACYIKTSLLSSLLQRTKYLLPMTSEWDQLVAWVGDRVSESVLCMGQCFSVLSVPLLCPQAVGASVRIFELLDRVSEVQDGEATFEPFKGGEPQKTRLSLVFATEAWLGKLDTTTSRTQPATRSNVTAQLCDNDDSCCTQESILMVSASPIPLGQTKRF